MWKMPGSRPPPPKWGFFHIFFFLTGSLSSLKIFSKIFFKNYYFYIWDIPVNFHFDHYDQKCCFPLEISKIFFKYLILLKNISKIFLKNIFFLHLGRPYQLLFSSLCSKMSKNTYVFINPQIPSLCSGTIPKIPLTETTFVGMRK